MKYPNFKLGQEVIDLTTLTTHRVVGITFREGLEEFPSAWNFIGVWTVTIDSEAGKGIRDPGELRAVEE